MLEAHPKAWLAHYYLGFSKLDNGSARDAIQSFQRAYELNDKLVRALVMIAQIHREDLSLPENSIVIYARVLKLEPANERARAFYQSRGWRLDEIIEQQVDEFFEEPPAMRLRARYRISIRPSEDPRV